MARKFKSFLAAFEEHYADMETPAQFKRWSAISALAGAIERKLWINTGDATFYCNLYTFLIGERATGKSYMSNIAMSLLEEVPGVTMAANKITEATFIKRLVTAGRERMFSYQDKSYPNSALFIYASEAASTFTEMHMGGGLINMLTDLFNCVDKPWSLKSYWGKETRAGGTEHVYNPCINLLACSTPSWLMSKVIKESDIDGGFGSRVLMVVYRGSLEVKEGLKTQSPEKAENKQRLVEELQHIATLQGPYAISKEWSEAASHYNKIHNERMRTLAFQDPMMAGCLARKAIAYLPKLSMVLAADCRDELILKAEDAHLAWSLLSSLEPEMPYAFKAFGISDEVKHLQEIWLYLNDRPEKWVSDHEIYVMFAKKYQTRKLNEGLADLIKQRRVERAVIERIAHFRLIKSEQELR